MSKKDAANARAEVRRPADGERLDVEGGLLEPGGVVGDNNERVETDLAALSQTSIGNHDEKSRRKLQPHRKVAKTPAPRWEPTVVGVNLIIGWWVYGEARF